MAEYSRRIGISFALMCGLCHASRAQAVAEYGRLTRQSSTATAKGYHTSTEITGVWKSLDKTLKGSPSNTGAQETSVTARVATVRSRTTVSKPTAISGAVYESPDLIQTGIAYEELIRRFGPPSFAVADDTGTTSASYQSKEGNVDLELQDGKVTKVLAAKPREIAVIVPK